MATTASQSPRYAVIRLKEKTDLAELFTTLLSRGLCEVSFVNHCIYGEDALDIISRKFLSDDAHGKRGTVANGQTSLAVEKPERPNGTASAHIPLFEVHEDERTEDAQSRKRRHVDASPSAALPSNTHAPPPQATPSRPCSGATPPSLVVTQADKDVPFLKSKEKCTMCGTWTYRHKIAVLSHVSRHSTYPPRKCPYCMATRNRIDNLRNHIRNDHPVEFERHGFVDPRTEEEQVDDVRLMSVCFPVFYQNYSVNQQLRSADRPTDLTVSSNGEGEAVADPALAAALSIHELFRNVKEEE